MVGRSIPSVYDIPAVSAEVYAAFTNVVPLGAQRGSGRAEATFMIERLVELYARKIGMDPAEVRLKNMVRPDQMPFDNRVGWLYDSGDYPATFRRALTMAMAGHNELGQMKAEARARGKYLGFAAVPFVAVSGVGPSPRMAKEGMLGGTWESCNLKVYPTGEICVMIGSKPHGQGHETSFGQIAADELGVPLSSVQVLHSDTKRATFGQGSYGSRSFSVGGAAVLKAAQMAKKKAIEMAAHGFKIPVEDVVYTNGRMYPKGHPEKARGLQDVALNMWYGWDLPAGMEPNLDVTTVYDPPDFNYPHGSQAVIVEVDENTGKVEIVRYVGVHDAGVPGNVMILEGQVHGGIVHGMGQALWEGAQFTDDGTLLTSTLSNYPLPRASNIPHLDVEMSVSPTPNGPLGAKGAGEIGTVGAPVVIANAVCDALAEFGISHIEMPLTPEKVWQAMQNSKRFGAGGGAI